MKTAIASWARRAASVAVIGLSALAGSAQAAIWVGKWDPLFNADFSALLTPGLGGDPVGWNGQITLDIAANCMTSSGLKTLTGPTPDCGPVTVVSAKVDFYNAANLAAIGSVTAWGPAPAVTKLYFDGSMELLGLDLSGPLAASTSMFDELILPSTPGTTIWADVSLDFVFDHPSTFVPTLSLAVYPCYSFAAGSICGDPSTPYPSGGEGPGDTRYQPSNFKFTQVPEPSSLALIVGAAWAGWGYRRRQR